VAIALRPTGPDIDEDGSGEAVVSEDEADVGDSRISALDVFFCRREYILSAVLRRAAVGEEVRVSLSWLAMGVSLGRS
jgi:hypothetical protein